MAPRTAAQLAQRQIKQWYLARASRTAAQAPAALPPPNVTLSRQLGCGAGRLAESLAGRLGLMIHDSSLIQAIADDKGLRREIVDRLDERTRSELDIWVEGILNRRLFSHSEFHVALARTIRTLATTGGGLFIGRGANMILDPDTCLRLRLVASTETRLRNVIQACGPPLDEALVRIEQSDAERRDFIRRFFGVEMDDPLHYDLVVNMDRFDAAAAVDTICEAMLARDLVPPQALRQARDG